MESLLQPIRIHSALKSSSIEQVADDWQKLQHALTMNRTLLCVGVDANIVIIIVIIIVIVLGVNGPLLISCWLLVYLIQVYFKMYFYFNINYNKLFNSFLIYFKSNWSLMHFTGQLTGKDQIWTENIVLHAEKKDSENINKEMHRSSL